MGYDSDKLVTVRCHVHAEWSSKRDDSECYRVTLDGERYRKRPDGLDEDISIIITDKYAEMDKVHPVKPSMVKADGFVASFTMPLWYAEARGLELGIE